MVQSFAKMNVEDGWSALETAEEDVDIFMKELSNSERKIFIETLLQCSLETPSGRDMPTVEPESSDLLLGTKVWDDGSERTTESGNEGGLCCATMTANSPGGVADLLQPIAEDQSLFCDLAQNDFLYPVVEDTHNHQLFEGHDMMSEFNNTQIFYGANLYPSQAAPHLSPEPFERYHPVETPAMVDDDWGSTSGHGFEVGSPGEAEPAQLCPSSVSPGFGFNVDSERTVTSPPNGFWASQRSRFDTCRSLSSNTSVPNEEISSAEVNQSQVRQLPKMRTPVANLCLNGRVRPA